MPQLSPTTGILIFLGVLFFYFLLLVAIKNTSTPLSSSPSSKKTSNFLVFYSQNGS
uniref:ATP synthase F0 subunit 8 n=1 Tax=Auriculastra duplicata TaxID=1628032 RepID=A0A343SWH4_9EUPU|nr:ATP synthase F0 subunit 8 [Auriculastra duplicata]AUT77324.1 ATP synthase F0 subunit 8 [Auriculastra duplicata]